MALTNFPHPGEARERRLAGRTVCVPCLGRLAREDVALEIALETLRRRGEPSVFGEMRLIARVLAGERQRPGAARRHGDRLDIEGREHARCARLAGEKVA